MIKRFRHQVFRRQTMKSHLLRMMALEITTISIWTPMMQYFAKAGELYSSIDKKINTWGRV